MNAMNDPDASVDKVAEDIMNEYHTLMKVRHGLPVAALDPNFREEVVLALIKINNNYEYLVYYSYWKKNDPWFYNPQFLARVADVVITKAKSERGDSYNIQKKTFVLVTMVHSYLHRNHGKDNDYKKTYTSFVNSIILRIPNIDTPHRVSLLKSFMDLAFTGYSS